MLEFFKSQNSNRMRFEIAGFEIAGSNRQIAGFGNAKIVTDPGLGKCDPSE